MKTFTIYKELELQIDINEITDNFDWSEICEVYDMDSHDMLKDMDSYDIMEFVQDTMQDDLDAYVETEIENMSNNEFHDKFYHLIDFNKCDEADIIEHLQNKNNNDEIAKKFNIETKQLSDYSIMELLSELFDRIMVFKQSQK